MEIFNLSGKRTFTLCSIFCLLLFPIQTISCQEQISNEGSGGHTTKYTGPIIDMHLHSYSDDFMGPAPNPATGNLSPANAREHMEQTFKIMEQFNIVMGAVLGDSDKSGEDWFNYAPEKTLRGIGLEQPSEFMSPETLQQKIRDGKIDVLGEVVAQYFGHSPSDPEYFPIYKIAEEEGIPVGIHTGQSFPGMPYKGRPEFRLRYGNPLLLEDLLVEYPNLKVYAMHAGGSGPYSEYAVMMMYMYPQLYVDLSILSWMPGMETVLVSFLQKVKAMGMLDRVMFGSDQMIWPEAIGLAVEGINSLDFLTLEEKANIFYNNAARFLELSEELISKHHNQ